MTPGNSEDDSKARTANPFATTHWSTVLQARDTASPDSLEALEKLCRQYWFPLYAFVRRKGYSPEDAKDLTQEFFFQLIERHRLRRVDPARGRFRSFLLTSLNHFLANEWDRLKSVKRGGRVHFLAWEDPDVEARTMAVLTTQLTPSQVFDQEWAKSVLGQVLSRLKEEAAAEGKAPEFEHAKPFLLGDSETGDYARSASALGTSADAFKMFVSRLRRRYGELLRHEIAQTVSTPAQLEEEWMELIAALRGGSG